MGRPKGSGKIEVTEDMYDKVQQLAGTGLNTAQIGAMLGMSRRTMYQRMQEDPRLKASRDEGRSKSVAMVVNRLFAKCMEGDYSAMQFFLRNVCPEDWGDMRKLAVEAINTAPVLDLSGVSDAALMELAQAPPADPDDDQAA